ncbi:MAG: hypothetical protein ACXW3L_06880, partial [Limisphaerales bacterium]
NLASRLEGASGRGRILISEATFKDLQRDDAALAALCVAQAPITPKGFRQAVRFYEVPWKPALEGNVLGPSPTPAETAPTSNVAAPLGTSV